MSVQTNLLGVYVSIPDEGDAGWIRAVFVADEMLYFLVQRVNSSRDLRVYNAETVVIPEVRSDV